jgi:hypothetical protein
MAIRSVLHHPAVRVLAGILSFMVSMAIAGLMIAGRLPVGVLPIVTAGIFLVYAAANFWFAASMARRGEGQGAPGEKGPGDARR